MFFYDNGEIFIIEVPDDKPGIVWWYYIAAPWKINNNWASFKTNGLINKVNNIGTMLSIGAHNTLVLDVTPGQSWHISQRGCILYTWYLLVLHKKSAWKKILTNKGLDI